MYPYLKSEDEEEEFKDILEIAWLLFSKRKVKREIAEKELLKRGVKSVRPLVCTIELGKCYASIQNIDPHAGYEDMEDFIDTVKDSNLNDNQNVFFDF
jgi:uncharacterized protein YeeX (DUF496 family)